MPDMSDTQLVFQELFSTYRVYFTSFIYHMMVYFTVIGTAFYGLIKIVFRNDIRSGVRVFLLFIVCAFAIVITLSYCLALKDGLFEAKTFESNIQSVLNALSLNPTVKHTLKMPMPCMLSKAVKIMLWVSISMTILIGSGFIFLVCYFRQHRCSQDKGAPPEPSKGLKKDHSSQVQRC